jgi:hypothetical protein
MRRPTLHVHSLALTLCLGGRCCLADFGLPYTVEEFTASGQAVFVVDQTPQGRSVEQMTTAAMGAEGGATSEAFADTLMAGGSDWVVSRQRPVKDRRLWFIPIPKFLDPKELPNVQVMDIERSSAAWLRLKLKVVDLRDASLTITSPVSGRSQTFSAATLEAWGGDTMIFKGARVRLILQDTSGSLDDVLVEDLVQQVYVGESLVPTESSTAPDEHGGSQGSEQVPCANDSRRLAHHPWVGRMGPRTCTVFLLETGFAATAGHCLRGPRNQQVEFNVPPSDEYGMMNPASGEDVYKVLEASVACSDCTSGVNLESADDWAIFKLTPNAGGEHVFHRQGAGFAVSRYEPGAGTVSVYGFGWDNDPGQARYASQLGTGSISRVLREERDGTTSEVLYHDVDAAMGSSGSPLLVQQGEQQYALGIHNEGSCEGGGAQNQAVSFHSAQLKEQLQR